MQHAASPSHSFFNIIRLKPSKGGYVFAEWKIGHRGIGCGRVVSISFSIYLHISPGIFSRHKCSSKVGRAKVEKMRQEENSRGGIDEVCIKYI